MARELEVGDIIARYSKFKQLKDHLNEFSQSAIGHSELIYCFPFH